MTTREKLLHRDSQRKTEIHREKNRELQTSSLRLFAFFSWHTLQLKIIYAKLYSFIFLSELSKTQPFYQENL